MTPKTKKTEEIIQEVTTSEEKSLVTQSPNDLAKPERDTKFAHESAKLLMDIVRKNNWARMLGGQQAHLQYEAWQTVGKYYGYTVRTGEAEEVTFGGISGFKAKAKVINEITGIEVGGAEAYCMRDENNWKQKPVFQLASMAQTRAGSKALRQILGFVVALAGYNPTPVEEMEGVHTTSHPTQTNSKVDEESQTEEKGEDASEAQINLIHNLVEQKGKSLEALEEKIWGEFGRQIKELKKSEASRVIKMLLDLKSVKKNPAMMHN